MFRLELTDQEANTLRETLTMDLSDLRMEIAHTENQEFREELKEKENVLRSLIGRLGDEHCCFRAAA